MTNGDVCISPLNGHYELVWSVWFVWFVWLVWLVWFVWSVWLIWSVCRANGPHQWVNPKLFEAVRPCFLGFGEEAHLTLNREPPER